MKPHPDFAERDIPREVDFGDIHLTPLTADEAEEDYDAVMTSVAELQGLFGDWPEGLTPDDNLLDLCWHDREFTLRRSFSWIIRDALGTYLGCVYLFPRPGTRGEVDAAAWLRSMDGRVDRAIDVFPLLIKWARMVVPEGTRLYWSFSPERPE